MRAIKKAERERLERERDYCKNLKALSDEIRTMRHNYRHSLNTISEFLKNNDIEEAKNFIEDIKSQVSSTEINFYSSNLVLQAILAHFATECLTDGIAFNSFIGVEISEEEAYHIGGMLETLLENARSLSLVSTSSSAKYINLTIARTPAGTAIVVKGNYTGKNNTHKLKRMARHRRLDLTWEQTETEFTAYLLLNDAAVPQQFP
jgi:sensor histidine kinase regulating citrate/malate metabolism